VWDSIPAQLARENRKFVFTALKKTARARDYENAIHWLETAGLILRAFLVTKPGQTLSAYADRGAFSVVHRSPLEGGALPCSRPVRYALRAIYDVLPQHRPVFRLSAPKPQARSAVSWNSGGLAAKVGRHGGHPSS